MHFDWLNPYPSTRVPLFARNVVATSQPLAAQAGVRILAQGGNAVHAGSNGLNARQELMGPEGSQGVAALEGSDEGLHRGGRRRHRGRWKTGREAPVCPNAAGRSCRRQIGQRRPLQGR